MASEEAILQVQHEYLLLQVRARELGPVLATRQCGECQHQDKARHGCSGQLSRAPAWGSTATKDLRWGCGKQQQAQLRWWRGRPMKKKIRGRWRTKKLFGQTPTPPAKTSPASPRRRELPAGRRARVQLQKQPTNHQVASHRKLEVSWCCRTGASGLEAKRE